MAAQVNLDAAHFSAYHNNRLMNAPPARQVGDRASLSGESFVKRLGASDTFKKLVSSMAKDGSAPTKVIGSHATTAGASIDDARAQLSAQFNAQFGMVQEQLQGLAQAVIKVNEQLQALSEGPATRRERSEVFIHSRPDGQAKLEEEYNRSDTLSRLPRRRRRQRLDIAPTAVKQAQASDPLGMLRQEMASVPCAPVSAPAATTPTSPSGSMLSA